MGSGSGVGSVELVTVKVAVLLVTDPSALVKMARYCEPLSELKAVKEIEVVLPLVVTLEEGMFVKVPVELARFCQMTLVKLVAVALKVAVWPDVRDKLAGWVVIFGKFAVTVRVAAEVVAVPEALVNTAW